MSDSIIVVGVDGGGTKTHVRVANAQGEILAEVVGAPSAVRPGDEHQSVRAITDAVREALARVGPDTASARVLCAGLAGVGREAEINSVRQALADEQLAEDVIVRADAEIALDDAFGESDGILLIAGTGSVAFARSPSGQRGRAGGWGPVFGDEGSGAWIGRRALSVITAAADEREPETALSGALLTAMELETMEGTVAWAANASSADFAALAPVVVTVADAGDLRANALLSLAAEELVLHVRALARRLFVDERAAIPVALTGGLLAPGAPLRRRVEHRLRSAVPGSHVKAEAVVPVRGAVKGALRLLGAE
jgi:glucosamine kinase